MADLADIAAQYNLTLHAFADDNQLYIHCKRENVQSAVTSVQQCVTAIDQWMAGTKHNLRRSVQEQHNYTKHKFSGERKNDFYL